MNRTIIFLIFLQFIIWGCGEQGTNIVLETETFKEWTTGTFIDERDNQTYKWFTIGSQTWMQENLNYIPSDTSVARRSTCYDYRGPGFVHLPNTNCKISDSPDEDGTTKHGRLYGWETAMQLEASYLSEPVSFSVPMQGICPAGWHIPNVVEWDTLNSLMAENEDTVRNPNGFAALNSGRYAENGAFLEANSKNYWWTAESNHLSYKIGYKYDKYSWDSGWFKKNTAMTKELYSVRCIKDSQ